ncbi:hypothetical protein RB597_010052 [Gaeumannomyces tritici]
MSAAVQRPPTTRVISPSPTPSERLRDAQASSQDSYLGPTTRSAARKRLSTPQPVEEDMDEDEYDGNPDARRPRTRSRSPIKSRRVAPLSSANGAKAAKIGKTKATTLAPTPEYATDEKKSKGSTTGATPVLPAIKTNGHLAPPTTAPPSSTSYWSWRDFSRSPSPLGLIPIHRHWRTFVHKHEVPRKFLHVSIGFVVVWLYLHGTQADAVWPWLLAALVPISAVDLLRHHHPGFNRFYVSVLGALMRESEFSGYNGVIFYLLGALIVLYCFPKDVGTVGTLLLSWCDTAASTFGRLYGAYTPRIRRGKSLAGSSAAFLVGVATAASFWGWLVPTYGPLPGDEAFMFRGSLSLPPAVAEPLGLSAAQATVSGPVALGVVSLWSGFVAAASEVVDVFGWDDNLTIPVLSGFFIWGFLKAFG